MNDAVIGAIDEIAIRCGPERLSAWRTIFGCGPEPVWARAQNQEFDRQIHYEPLYVCPRRVEEFGHCHRDFAASLVAPMPRARALRLWQRLCKQSRQ
jgi:hypothetical protein